MPQSPGRTAPARLVIQSVSANCFTLGNFFAIAIPLADALAAAHQQGITHRDLKPNNVMVSDEGRVKVLDFGVATAPLDFWSPSGQLDSPSASQEGHIVGTPAYMSPEQAEGKKVDPRSDIFSLGIVLYEMLTGQRPFSGATSASVMSSITQDTPRPVSQLKPAVPRGLVRLVHRCLAKDPIGRYQSAIDLRLDLEEMKRDVESGDSIPSPRAAGGLRSMWMWGSVATALVVVAASIWLFRSREERSRVAVPRLQNAFQVTSALDVESYPTWSPDGVRLAYQASDVGYNYAGNHDIWVAQLGSGEPVNLTKSHPANDRMPSWSPDGREIAFFSDRAGEWGVYTVAAIGGTPRHLLSLSGMGNVSWSAPQWSRDGTELRVAVRQAGENVVIVLSVASLKTTRVVLPPHDGNVCVDLSVSSDGRRFTYVEGASGATEVTRLWTIPASGGAAIPLTDGRTNVWSPTWSPDGRKVFYVSNRGGSMDLWQQAIAEDGQPVGEPLAVTQGLGIRSAAFSPDGARVAYTRGGKVSNVWRVPILSGRPASWADAVQLTSERAFIEFVEVSPNGEHLAVSSDRRGNQDIWLLPAAGGDMIPLTTDQTPDWAPRWSPRGDEIAFYSYRSGNRDIWVMPSRGGPVRQLTAHPGQDRNPRWSPDGRQILFHSTRPEGRGSWTLDANGGEGRFVMASGDAGDDGGDWAPDGQWLVLSTQGRLYRVPNGGGEPLLLLSARERPLSPRFSRDGHSIYYSVITGPRENHDLWKLSLADSKVSRLTKLEGRRGRVGYFFAADARYLYLTWNEDDGDIWVMDVMSDGTS